MCDVYIRYWDIRGRGEGLRNFLHYNDVEFEDKRYGFANAAEWFEEDKKALGFEFPNLPYLIDGDLKVDAHADLHCLRTSNPANVYDIPTIGWYRSLSPKRSIATLPRSMTWWEKHPWRRPNAPN